MKKNEYHKLAEKLEKQGARVRRTKSGYVVYTQLGSACWHVGQSENRSERNTKADIERLGLTWPL